MQTQKGLQKILQKRFPTLIGIGILVASLVVGLLFFGQGTGVFAPQASPQTTPKNIKITNVTDTGFTVSFVTDQVTPGFVRYGTDPKEMKLQASDDRDQLSGTVGEFTTHHISVRGLEAGTPYHFTLGTAGRSSFDNGGVPFTVTTAQSRSSTAISKTVYGTILTESGSPAGGSIVYVTISGAGPLSSLVKDSGSWAIPLATARKEDGSGAATITDATPLAVTVQGPQVSQATSLEVTVAEAQPVADITFGQLGGVARTTERTSPTATDTATVNDQSILEEFARATSTGASGSLASLTNTATGSGTATSSARISTATGSATTASTASTSARTATSSATTATASPSAVPTLTTVDLTKDSEPVIATQKPKIVGKAAANATVSITVNSETQIQQTVVANANGEFELDISKLSETLEPGDHSVTYSYADPVTGEIITKTQNFTVQPPQNQILASNTYPYSSSNPYTSTGGVPTGAGTSTASAKGATGSGRTSQPATNSAVPVSGSVETTLALLIGGFLFMLAGGWSYWLAAQVETAVEHISHTSNNNKEKTVEVEYVE